MVVKRKHKPAEDLDMILKLHQSFISVFVKLFKGIQLTIITKWVSEFERVYLNAFKKLDTNQSDATKVMGVITTRIKNHNFTMPLTIILQYTPSDKFNILSTYTPEEIEYEEFLKWKNKKK